MEFPPQPGTTFHQKIKVLLLLVRFLPAKIHVQSALKQYKDPVLYNLLGICLIELSDYGNAEKAFEGALKMNPNFDGPNLIRSNAFVNKETKNVPRAYTRK